MRKGTPCSYGSTYVSTLASAWRASARTNAFSANSRADTQVRPYEPTAYVRASVSLRANTQNRGDDGVMPPSPRFCRSVCHSSLGGVSLVRRVAFMPLAVIVKTPTSYRA